MLRHALTLGSVISALLGGSMLHPYLNGSVGHHIGGLVTASGLKGGVVTGQGLIPAAALFICVSLVLILGRLAIDGDGPLVPIVERTDRSVARKGATFAAVALVVSTAALSGVGGQYAATGTASAELKDCDLLSGAWELAYNTITSSDSGCRWQAGDTTDWQSISELEAYQSGLALKDGTSSYVRSTSNLMENSRTVGISKGKITLVTELNNGSGQAVTETRVNDSVDDYYSQIELDLVNDWNARMQHVRSINESASVRIGLYGTDGSEGHYPASEWYWTNKTHTTVNGTTVNVSVPVRSGSAIDPFTDAGPDTSRNGFIDVQDPEDGTWDRMVESAEYGDANEELSGTNTDGYAHLHDEVVSHHQYVIDNLDPYVGEVFSQYSSGELDATDLARMDPTVIGSEAATSFNSTGYYGHAAIMLASIGAGGNINVSHTIETGDGTTLNGTLYYTAGDVPAGGWATNTTYNLSNFNGTAYMAVQKDDGNATIVDLANYGSTFTITSATNTQTGESVNSTTVHRYVYDSTNASALAEEIDRLRELRDTYQNQQATSGGGGWGLGGASTGAIAALLLVVALFVLKD